VKFNFKIPLYLTHAFFTPRLTQIFRSGILFPTLSDWYDTLRPYRGLSSPNTQYSVVLSRSRSVGGNLCELLQWVSIISENPNFKSEKGSPVPIREARFMMFLSFASFATASRPAWTNVNMIPRLAPTSKSVASARVAGGPRGRRSRPRGIWQPALHRLCCVLALSCAASLLLPFASSHRAAPSCGPLAQLCVLRRIWSWSTHPGGWRGQAWRMPRRQPRHSVSSHTNQ